MFASQIADTLAILKLKNKVDPNVLVWISHSRGDKERSIQCKNADFKARRFDDVLRPGMSSLLITINQVCLTSHFLFINPLLFCCDHILILHLYNNNNNNNHNM